MEDLAASLSQLQKNATAKDTEQQNLINQLQKQVEDLKIKEADITKSRDDTQTALKDRDAELKNVQRELGKFKHSNLLHYCTYGMISICVYVYI